VGISNDDADLRYRHQRSEEANDVLQGRQAPFCAAVARNCQRTSREKAMLGRRALHAASMQHSSHFTV
jgi:hypothetical protein